MNFNSTFRNPRKPMRRVSEKREREAKIYSELRRLFLEKPLISTGEPEPAASLFPEEKSL
jgi:hypothetical protein